MTIEGLYATERRTYRLGLAVMALNEGTSADRLWLKQQMLCRLIEWLVEGGVRWRS